MFSGCNVKNVKLGAKVLPKQGKMKNNFMLRCFVCVNLVAKVYPWKCIFERLPESDGEQANVCLYVCLLVE